MDKYFQVKKNLIIQDLLKLIIQNTNNVTVNIIINPDIIMTPSRENLLNKLIDIIKAQHFIKPI